MGHKPVSQTGSAEILSKNSQKKVQHVGLFANDPPSDFIRTCRMSARAAITHSHYDIVAQGPSLTQARAQIDKPCCLALAHSVQYVYRELQTLQPNRHQVLILREQDAHNVNMIEALKNETFIGAMADRQAEKEWSSWISMRPIRDL